MRVEPDKFKKTWLVFLSQGVCGPGEILETEDLINQSHVFPRPSSRVNNLNELNARQSSLRVIEWEEWRNDLIEGR